MFEAHRFEAIEPVLRASFPFAASGEVAFRPLIARLRAEDRGADSPDTATVTVIDPAEIEAEAFAAGLEEGRRIAALELAGERAAMADLARALDALTPEPSRDLALLLSETVGRLVRQAIGEVAIDDAKLLARAEQVAALIAEANVPSRMRMHPDDAARLADADLPVTLVPDAALSPGTVLLETGEGWIESGPDVAIEKLEALLDRLGAPQ